MKKMMTFILAIGISLGCSKFVKANDRDAYFERYERKISEYLEAYQEFSPEFGLFNEDGTFVLGLMRNGRFEPVPERLVRAMEDLGLALYPQKNNLSLVEYEEILMRINAKSQDYPLAIRDLSFYLEEKGEGRFYDQAPIYTISQNSQVESSSVLAYVGLALATTSLFKNPQKVLTNSSGTMSLMRAFRSVVLPVAGYTTAGTLAAEAHKAKYPGNINPPPYFYLDFGIPKNQDCLGDILWDKKINEVVAEGTGLATGWVAGAACAVRWGGRAAQTVNTLATPAKIHPLVLVGSIVVGVVVDRAVAYGTEALMEYGDKLHWQNQVLEAVKEFDEIFARDYFGRTPEYYEAVSKLMRATYELEAYYNFTLYKAFLDYQTKLADLYAKYPDEATRNTLSAFKNEAEDLKRQTVTLLLPIWSEKQESRGEEFIKKKVRDILTHADYSHIEENWSHFDEREQKVMNEYVAQYEIWKAQRERRESFREYISDENVYSRIRLVQNLQDDYIAENAEDLMVQVASYLESKNTRILKFYANQLLNRVKRNEIFLQQLVKGE